jgi:hypothetical protein
MTAPDLSGVEQLPQPDPRGVLALRYLPPDLENAENATQVNDYAWRVRYPRGRTRPGPTANGCFWDGWGTVRCPTNSTPWSNTRSAGYGTAAGQYWESRRNYDRTHARA